MLLTKAQILSSFAERAVPQKQFNALINSLWTTKTPVRRMAIALSGGSDSMALATLCHKLSQHDPRHQFVAFIIDHAARVGSDAEARSVRNVVMSKTGIDTQIIRLQWNTDHPIKLRNFESAARRARYQALAQACFEQQNIPFLLLGHHADDNVETVLSRINNGYLDSGLQGIPRIGDIPECHDTYGTKSGSPLHIVANPAGGSLTAELVATTIEGGGLKIVRPLLDFTKLQLRATCIANRLRWYEDKTNRDPKLGIRNAMRHLLANNLLPAALTSDNVTAFISRKQKSLAATNAAVEAAFNNCVIALNLATGSAVVTYTADAVDALCKGLNRDDVDNVELRYRAALLVRRVIILVSPKPSVKMQDMERSTVITFPHLFPQIADPKLGGTTTVGSVIYSKVPPARHAPPGLEKTNTREIRRAPLSADLTGKEKIIFIKETKVRTESYGMDFTKKLLWDGRYWIRLRYRKFNVTPGHRFTVRFLREADIAAMHADPEQAPAWKSLKEALRSKAPGPVRFTLPAIIESFPANNPLPPHNLIIVKRLVALPTLDWGHRGWRQYSRTGTSANLSWEIRYKQVDFGASSAHEFVA